MPFGLNPLTGRPGPAPKSPRDGDVLQARQRVNVEVRTGYRPNPNDLPCIDCGHLGLDRRHEYHHFKGYAPEHHLDVEPLCAKCHRAREVPRPTHCKRGHAFDEANTVVAKNGTRHCRECRRIYERNTRTAEWWRARRARRAEQ
jgi:hypothetical protein